MARRVLRLCLLFGVLLIGGEVCRVVLGSNFHTVVPGECYRSAQPSPRSLEDMARTRGIRTVINLRGRNENEDWFQREVEAAQRLGVNLVHIMMSGNRKPEETHLRKLVETLDNAPRPILVHCCQGGDRSGMAAACYLLLHTPADLAQAERQLSLRFGHNPWGRAGCQEEILRAYGAWLEGQNLLHAPDYFRKWVENGYVKDDWGT